MSSDIEPTWRKGRRRPPPWPSPHSPKPNSSSGLLPLPHHASCSLPTMPSSLLGMRRSVSSAKAWWAIGTATPKLSESLHL
jgi:hypothetical protein